MEIPPELFIKQIEIGPMGNFAYFIGEAGTKEIAVVDPGWDIEQLADTASNLNLNITGIILTHGHYDHIQCTEDLLKKLRTEIPVYISQEDRDFFSLNIPNLIKIKDRQKINIGNIVFESILSPGHSPGCMCYYYRSTKINSGVLITGDVLFIGAIGRCDFPGGDPEKMYDTLYNKLMKLPDETLIFSGHGYGRRAYDTLGHQKQVNPYLKSKNKEEFMDT